MIQNELPKKQCSRHIVKHLINTALQLNKILLNAQCMSSIETSMSLKKFIKLMPETITKNPQIMPQIS